MPYFEQVRNFDALDDKSSEYWEPKLSKSSSWMMKQRFRVPKNSFSLKSMNKLWRNWLRIILSKSMLQKLRTVSSLLTRYLPRWSNICRANNEKWLHNIRLNDDLANQMSCKLFFFICFFSLYSRNLFLLLCLLNWMHLNSTLTVTILSTLHNLLFPLPKLTTF